MLRIVGNIERHDFHVRDPFLGLFMLGSVDDDGDGFLSCAIVRSLGSVGLQVQSPWAWLFGGSF